MINTILEYILRTELPICLVLSLFKRVAVDELGIYQPLNELEYE